MSKQTDRFLKKHFKDVEDFIEVDLPVSKELEAAIQKSQQEIFRRGVACGYHNAALTASVEFQEGRDVSKWADKVIKDSDLLDR